MPFLVLHVVFSFLLDLAHALTRSDHDQALELVLLRQQLRLYERQAKQPRPSRWEKVVSWPISPSVSLYAAASYAWCRPPKMGTACTLPGNIARGARPSGASGTRCRRP